MNRPRLIVGIDPGTTVGFALLGVKGNILKINSSKHLNLDKLISKIITVGKPIAVGCDKAKIPFFVEKFSARLGIPIFYPSEDLKVSEKRTLVKDNKTNNEHEMDSLAAAMFALNQTSRLFRKIDKYLIGKQQSHLSEQVKELVLKKEISISKVLASLIKN